MAAYIIADLDIKDREGFESYTAQVPDIIAKHGGKYIVRGGEFEIVEGDWDAHRIIILEFPDMAAVRRFWDTDEYKEILPLRLDNADSRVLFVDGV